MRSEATSSTENRKWSDIPHGDRGGVSRGEDEEEEEGCDLSGDNYLVINGHQGGSVLLPCSCSDLHAKPQTFTWEYYRTGFSTDVLNDELYRGRLQLFNNISPGNLSLLISDLRVEDGADYRTKKRNFNKIRENRQNNSIRTAPK
ncbi:hypothetical protein QTP70_009897 [Hemibagrus guttatus]|uniref:Immunoglobulin V-set domain-containing protein n=1 Tax=Hemibagrus guttatus TaxID=175788 RepID=A0AAE0UHT2_9TELE|nr:hypothetical protein QTP70_009897 [Hemibagrus guttatus]